ncbi:MAG: MFS transporter [Candidatus Hodarchaeales archaeon]
MNSTATRQTLSMYLIFWLGQLISSLGSNIVQFVLLWWIVVEYLNPMYLSLAYLLAIGVQVILLPFAGVCVDRWNRKLVLGISDALQACGAFGLILLFTMKDSFHPLTMYWLVVALLTFRAIAGAFHAPAANAIIPLMVPREKFSQLNGIQFLFLGVINILGPAIGAILYSVFPLNLVIWVDCITFITAIIPLFLIKIPVINNIPIKTDVIESTSFIREFREGFNIMRSKKGLLPLLFAITIIQFLEIPIIVLGPFFVYTIHLGGVLDLALVVVASQFGLLVSGILLSIKKNWKRPALIIVIALYVQVAGYFFQVITPIGLFWFMSIGAFIFGAMLPFINSMFQTIIHSRIPPELQGRANGLATSMAGAILPIGMLLSGPISDFIGIAGLFFIANILSIATLSLILVFTDLRSLDHFHKINVQKDAVTTQQAISITN